MKGIVLIALLISLGLSVTVTDDSKCTLCTEFKSQADCENSYHGLGCEWKDSACAKKTTPPAETFKSYCESIEDPATKCAKTFGCAYVDGKCTHFTGCTAYVKTTLADCQTISYRCLTNGTTCDDVKECTEYTAENCEASPAFSSPFKCKLDNGACRALNCSEAETSLQTTPDCRNWKSNCITNGYGCVESLSNCSQYTGNVDSCLKMLGSDGKCSFDSTTTDKCKLRICAEAKPSSYDDTLCKEYKGTCVSTGFSCADSLSSCAAYDGNQTTCLTYIGTAGKCAADANATKCRDRKCEDLKSGVLTECQGYIGTCLTNGVTCVTSLQTCAQYTGKKADCLKITGSDGKCKGTSDTDSNAACVLKTCADGTGTETTDDACEKVQRGCKTTGAGCIDRLASCTSYPDDGNCLKRVGSEGKCKVGTAGKCAAKACVDNTTATTNAACNEFKTGCVTSGAGCIVQSSCKDTVKQITCDETFESSEKCGWSPICVSSTSCAALNTKSLCLNYKVDTKPCFWENNACRLALCSDYTSADSTVCNTYKTGCISNGTKCANPANCPTEFTGTKATCEGYPSPAHCTNDDTAVATAACKNKDCSDTTITAAQDSDCEGYLPGCLYAGTNKCIINTAPCSSYQGTVEVCNTFTGYLNSTNREKCSSSNGTTCTSRQCHHAVGMTNNDDCNTFLDECLYNGNGSCVSPSAGCSSYRYVTNANECRAFKGNSGANLCYDGSSNQCKDKACSDETSADVDSDSECGNFMTTCVYNGKTGTRCVPNTNDCTTFEGTSDQCNLLTRNEQQCTRTESCKTRVCSEKTDANSNSDCTAYHSSCRLTHNSTNCVDSKAACTLYPLVTSQTDQQTYCNVVTLTNGGLCSYNTGTTANCVARECKYWVSSLATTISCVNYLGKDTCALANTDYCYAVGACSSYSIPNSVTTGQAAWCNNLKSTAGLKCTHTGSGSTCADITTCEGVPSPVDNVECQLQSKQSNCIFSNGKCLTLQTACTGYSLASVLETNKATICSGLKSDDSGTVKPCTYKAATSGTCVELTCEDIVSPTSQVSCASVPNCTYYDGKCYTKKVCTSYTLPSSANTAALKRLYCQNMTSNTAATFCSYDAAANSNAGGCAASKQCSGYSETTLEACNVLRDQDGTICTFIANAAACSIALTTDICGLVTGITSDNDCHIRTSPFCYNVSGTCTAKACTDLDGSDVATCQALKGAGGLYCTWTTSTKCSVGQNSCADWSGATVAACSPLIDKNGKKCTWKTGTTCTDLTCEEVQDPKSQVDCDIISSGCTFYRGYCIKNGANCNTYAANGADAAKKLTYCSGRVTTDSTPIQCTYVAGANCVNKAACNSYNVSSLANATEKTTNCKNSATTDANGCTFFAGTTCGEIQTACVGYSGLTAAGLQAATYCLDYKTSAGKQCIGVTDANACSSPADCESITSPSNQASCDLYVSGCLFQNNSCMTPDTCDNYATGGSNAISFCKGLKDSVGNYCTATTNTDNNCTTRTCGDADAAFFTTHAECKAYSNLCKSDGFGCITASTACTIQKGILSIKTCDSLLDVDGNSCTVADPQAAAACKVKSCSDNITAKSQADCDSFMTGCKWINPGCTDKTTPCTSYRGTQTECGGFIGNSLPCWSDSPTRGACRVKTCQDKSTAADDAECQNFLDGCVFNGVGCVIKNSSCASFRGTKDTCSTFDKNSSSPCWSVSATVGPCTNKLCTHLASTKDSDCESFLPDSNCITDGTTCIQGPKPCSYFRGNADTCPLFKSNQGTCKKGLSGFCAKRECYEAPFTYTKDTQCSTWSPGCVTNGRGCQSSVSCSDFQNQATCGAVTGCQWASSCKAAVTSCSSLTTSGQSICVNNPKKKCAWYNGTCRDPTCVDLDSTLNTHELCKAALTTQTCTTTGEGCIQQGVCASYTTKTICEAAETTETEKKCTWKNASCRVRKCEDFDGTSDDACDKFLSKCKTTGATCVAAPYGCSVFDGNQKYCLTDSSGNPCLYVEGKCYNYDECKDVTSPSRTQCKSFSTNCVAGSTTCIALNQCSKYTDLTSCYNGINSTVCGWLPSQQCAEFKQCGDATGTTLNECVAWNKTCVSDGTACVPIGDCAGYLKPQSCQDNYDTAGNACFWTGTACRLKQCTDVTATTDTECQQNVVKEGVCTTNGTSCVLRAACTTYSTEPACTVGSDGIPCIFALPLGATTGNKSCRAQDCTDILGTTNELCIGKINNKNCVSNGKTCVSQGTCASYKNKVSCSGGGSDNSKCIFTAAATTADPLAGTCQAFTSCASASGDSATCVLNKSCKYTDSTKKCETTDCKTFTPSGQCQPIPSFDGKTFTICTSSANGCTAGDPTALAQADCYSLVSKYTYTWNTSTSKCQSCKGSTTTTNNSTNGNTTTNTTTDSGYVLGVSMALAILGFLA